MYDKNEGPKAKVWSKIFRPFVIVVRWEKN